MTASRPKNALLVMPVQSMSDANFQKCPRCKREGAFRSEYDIGIGTGKFEVHYEGRCVGSRDSVGCAFEVIFDHEQTLDAGGDAAK